MDVFRFADPESAALLADCVHCGFCLPACPTYELWGAEADSPRGRIHLMALAQAGEVPLGPSFVGHMDACLGCLACVTACPSGVQYGELIEATRDEVERSYRRPLRERMFRKAVLAVGTRPTLLRVGALLAWLYQRLGLRAAVRRLGLTAWLGPRAQALEGLLPPVDLRGALRGGSRRHVPAAGRPRRRVGMVTGCVQSVFFSRVNDATARVLAAEGCEVVIPARQPCCGALLAHSGEGEAAQAHARSLIDAFDGTEVDTIVINAAGCGSTLKEYRRLLRDDPEHRTRAEAFSARVRDVSELLEELGADAERHPLHGRVAYQAACHLAHGQGIDAQPRAQLARIPGLELLSLGEEPELCCGSAGIYNLLQPGPAEALGRRKAASIAALRPDVVVTANPGCMLQIRRFLDAPLPLLHPVQLIDASIRGVQRLEEITW